MKTILTIFFLLTIFACKKESANCPPYRGLYLLPPTFKAERLYIGLNQNPKQISYIQSIAETENKKQKPIPIDILIPREQSVTAYQLLKSVLKFPFVRAITTPANEVLWPQDYMEIPFDITAQKNILLDLPYNSGEGELVPSALALLDKSDLISWPPHQMGDGPITAGDYGGNIESLPGDLIVVGDNILPASRLFLKNIFPNQELIEIQSSWLKTGHIDELISVIPTKDSDVSGFAILYPSPKLALQLLQENQFNPNTDILFFQDELAREKNRSKDKFVRCLPNRSRNRDCQAFIQANMTYQGIIEKNISLLAKKIYEKTKSNVLKLIPLPQLFVFNEIKTKYGEDDDQAETLNPSVANNLVLENHLYIATQHYPPFMKYLKSQLAQTGETILFVDADHLQNLLGGLHCNSNVVRSCR